MKQLKFMLAAATAISLATAAQAGTNYSGFPDNFDSATAGDAATTLTGYDYQGTTASDNESVVQAGGYNGSANALKVNTGTEPLLRAIDYVTAANAVELDKSKAVEKINSLTIDTMVQFTVTPEGDSVTATADDKLMIYLKEKTVGDTKSNVLMVKAAKYVAAVPPAQPKFTAVDAEIPNVTVVPNAWYRLVVTTELNPAKFAQFRIQLAKEGESLVYLKNVDGLLNTDDEVFPSLQGKASTALTYVGFAGEGLVDDLVVSRELDVPSSVDFTFTWTTAGITSVTYTIGDAEPVAVTSGVKIENLAPNAVLTLTVTPAEWYKVADNAVLSYTATKVGDSAALDDLVTVVTTKVDPDTGDVVVNPGESVPVADIQKAAGIEDGAFAAPDTSKADLEKALTWKNKNNANGKADINKITFNTTSIGVEPASSEAEAYLLDCDPQNLESEKDKFKLEITFDENGLPEVAGPEGASTYKNGTVVLKGRTSLATGDWEDKADGHKFFKAFLVK